MIEMVERVGAALYADWVAEDFSQEYCAWAVLLDKETWRRRARAAIAAMREPTHGQLRVVVQQVDDPSPENWSAAEAVCASLTGPNMEGETAVAELARDWQAMIDAALGAEG